MKTPFSLLIKPVSADCNLSCDYCFYLQKGALYPDVKRHRMTDEVLERVISSYLSTEQPVYSFGWQGGEPTLMGSRFFESVVALQQRYGKSGSVVGNGLQTNTTLIDERLARHLSRYNYLVGCSLDGPRDIHDRYRCSRDGRGSFERVIQGIELLRSNDVEVNILILVSRANVFQAKTVYRYLLDNGYTFHQYIPCVEFNETGELEPYAITGKEWGVFLCELFDQWYPEDTHKVSIRQFDAILNKKIDGVSTVCAISRHCHHYFVVEYNGDIYPCDFYVNTPQKLGNIMEITWRDLWKSPIYQDFSKRKQMWHPACDRCEYLSICHGDCQKFRSLGGVELNVPSYLCEGWKLFFHHSREGFERLTDNIRQRRLEEQYAGRSAGAFSKRSSRNIGRNQLCPCGSGLKYKKCCQKD